MRIGAWLAAITAGIGLMSGGIVAQPALIPDPTPTQAGTNASAGAMPGGQLHALTKTDVDAWLDGMIPYALETGDIAGGVVVVVKDGQIVTARGFGHADKANGVPVDPERTLFRLGSVAKLLTWTALMQLVEAGKVDLDADVNRYIDFKIPDAFGKPVTVRDLMTHTPGFEEVAKYLIVTDPKAKPSLERGLKRWVPTRIYPPGTTAAYSNYGAALAGYIVQRVSNQRFEEYVRDHITAPLGMTRSTFEQHLPAQLAATMSNGYVVASQPPEPFERLDLGPAGALSATGTDMARFMIAHLENGRGLLRPETTALMHAPAHQPIPGLPAMALGFYHQGGNELTVIGHGGDTNWFHSDLHLYPERDIGIFMSFNSVGKDRAAYPLRQAVSDQFTHRYLAPAGPERPTVADARRYADAVSGTWIMSRGAFTNWLSIAALLQPLTVARNEDDTITVSALRDNAGNIKTWRAIGPFLWQEVGGDELLGARTENGRAVAMSSAQLAPIIVFLRAPANMDGNWIMPLLTIAMAIILITALSWPTIALMRRRYRYASPLAGRQRALHRAGRLGAWLLVAVPFGWATIVTLVDVDVGFLDGRLDPAMRLLQVLTLLGIAGTIAALLDAWFTVRRKDCGWLTKAWAILFALAAVFLCWVLINFHTLTPSLNF